MPLPIGRTRAWTLTLTPDEMEYLEALGASHQVAAHPAWGLVSRGIHCLLQWARSIDYEPDHAGYDDRVIPGSRATHVYYVTADDFEYVDALHARWRDHEENASKLKVFRCTLHTAMDYGLAEEVAT